MARSVHPDARSALSRGTPAMADSYVGNYRRRGYARLIVVGQILALIGLFFGFYWLGSILLLAGGIWHFVNSRMRIRLLESRLRTFQRADR